MAELAGHARQVHERARTRETNQKVPVFEEIDLGIERPEVEEGLTTDQRRRKGNVVVDQEQAGVVILREKPKSGVRFGLAGLEERGDRVGVCGNVRVRAGEGRQMLGIVEVVVVEESDERIL